MGSALDTTHKVKHQQLTEAAAAQSLSSEEGKPTLHFKILNKLTKIMVLISFFFVVVVASH